MQAKRMLFKHEAFYLAESGISRGQYFLSGGDGKGLSWETDLFTEKFDDYGTIELTCHDFGLFKNVSSTGIRKNKKKTIHGLIYQNLPTDLFPKITLTGHIGGLVLDYKSSINGNIVLHHGVVKKGSGSSQQKIAGSEKWTILKESPDLPFDRKRIDRQFGLFEKLYQKSGTVPSSDSSISLNTENDTIIINGNGTLLAGTHKNSLFIVKGKAIVKSGVALEQSTIIAGDIPECSGTSHFSLFYSENEMTVTGGNHESQFWSNKKSIIQKGEFGPLSLWINRFTPPAEPPTDTIKEYGVILHKEAKLLGNVISLVDSSSDSIKSFIPPAIHCNDGVTLHGTLISNGDISIKNSTLNGSLWCRSLVTEVKGVTYKNWLFGTTFGKLGDVKFPLVSTGSMKIGFQELE